MDFPLWEHAGGVLRYERMVWFSKILNALSSYCHSVAHTYTNSKEDKMFKVFMCLLNYASRHTLGKSCTVLLMVLAFAGRSMHTHFCARKKKTKTKTQRAHINTHLYAHR